MYLYTYIYIYIYTYCLPKALRVAPSMAEPPARAKGHLGLCLAIRLILAVSLILTALLMLAEYRATVEGTNCATLEQNLFIKYLTNHKQRRRLPYKAMCLETQNRDVPALPSSLCFILARHHSHMR